jgi:hypothetical protein
VILLAAVYAVLAFLCVLFAALNWPVATLIVVLAGFAVLGTLVRRVTGS